MTLQEHVAKTGNNTDARRAASTALYNAIAAAVAVVEEKGGGVDSKIPRLKALAEAFALVAHGKE